MTSKLQIIIGLTAYLFMYYSRHIHRAKIYTKNKIIRSLSPGYIFPLFYIPFGFLQSFYQLWRKTKILSGTRVGSIILKSTHDADIFVQTYEPKKIKNIADNILLIHGLNGSSDSTYIKGMSNTFLRRGCRIFCFNARGIKLPAKSNYFGHIGNTEDIKVTVNYILENYTGNIMLIGFSMGSNWAAKFFSEFSNPRVKSGIGVCCPFDFKYLNEFFKGTVYKRLINFFVAKNYKRYLRKVMISPPDLDRLDFLEQIDEAIIKYLGYSNLESFYSENSCKSVIHKIKKPFLFINTEDDPLIPVSVIPVRQCANNPNTGVILIKGGHLGCFVHKNETTIELIAGEFYDKLFDYKNN